MHPDSISKEIKRINCDGLQCTLPIAKVFETINELKENDIIEVSASDPGFFSDIDAWCRHTGNILMASEKQGKEYITRIKKKSE